MKPMLATAGPLPAGPEWAYEVKWDGVRLLAELHPNPQPKPSVSLRTRSGREVTLAFPELHGAWAGGRTVVDGEVVADALTFEALMHRLHVSDPARARRAAAAHPVSYVLFDVLLLDGQDVASWPYAHRRQALAALPMPGPRWSVPASFDDGPALLAATKAQGLEGVVAKRRDSPYRCGTRSTDWVKVAHVHTEPFVVGGWAPLKGRTDLPGSLALGRPIATSADPAGHVRLRYCGMAGSGLSDELSARVRASLRPAARSAFLREGPQPAGDLRLVEPTLVVEVRFLGRTANGQLRQPVVLGIRAE